MTDPVIESENFVYMRNPSGIHVCPSIVSKQRDPNKPRRKVLAFYSQHAVKNYHGTRRTIIPPKDTFYGPRPIAGHHPFSVEAGTGMTNKMKIRQFTGLSLDEITEMLELQERVARELPDYRTPQHELGSSL